MREIEVKAKLRDMPLAISEAAKLGIVFGEPTTQDDTTYVTKTTYSDPDWNIFRLRKQNGKTILTMKYAASSRSRDNHEHETVVEDPSEIADMLKRLGYTPGVRVIKTRRKANYEGLEICIDEVEELGNFIEVEKLADDAADVDKIQKELWDILLQLGVKTKDRTHKGYDMLMRDFIKKH